VTTLRIGVLSPVREVDPRESLGSGSALVADLVFEPLVRAHADGVTPVLVDGSLRRETSVMGRSVYSADVLAGVEFSDGQPLTGDRVSEWLEGSPSVDRHLVVHALGDRLVVSPRRKYVNIPAVLARRSAAIARATAAAPDERPDLLGTGPYMLAPDSRPLRIHLVANPRARVTPSIDELIVSAYPADETGRPSALLDAVAEGAVDFTAELSRQDTRSLTQMARRYEPANNVAVLFLNCARGPLSQRDARLELAAAIDPGELASALFEHPQAFVARSVLPPTLAAGARLPRWSAPASTGALRGVRLRIVIPWAPRPYLAEPRRVAMMLADRITASTGASVETVAPASAAESHAIIRSGDYEATLGGWVADGPDRLEFLRALLHSESIPSTGTDASDAGNTSRWADPDTDALLTGAVAGVVDPVPAVMKRISEEAPLVPLIYGAVTLVHDWSLRELALSYSGVPDFANAVLQD
jgi:ABC-type transport system substrate-binding protein